MRGGFCRAQKPCPPYAAVGANLFAHNLVFVRINSHLRKSATKNWSAGERNTLLVNHPARLHVLLRLMLPLDRIQLRRLLRGYRLDLFLVLLQHRLNLARLMHLHSLFWNHGCLCRLFCLIHFHYPSFNQTNNKKKKPPDYADGFSDTAAKPEQPIILKSSVDGLVGANSFARSTSYVRMNSHLQKRHNPLKYLITLCQQRDVGLYVRNIAI